MRRKTNTFEYLTWFQVPAYIKDLSIRREGFQLLTHAWQSRVKQEASRPFWQNVQSKSGPNYGCVLIQSKSLTSAAYPVLVKVSVTGQVHMAVGTV